MIRLVQEFGAHAGRQLQFDQPVVRMGRAPTNEVVFDPNIDLDSSAMHCEIRRDPGGYVVVDAGSRNGTFVNGQRLQAPHRLQPNDVIECGRGGPRLRVEPAMPMTAPGYASGSQPPNPYGAPPPSAFGAVGSMPGAPMGANAAPYGAVPQSVPSAMYPPPPMTPPPSMGAMPPGPPVVVPAGPGVAPSVGSAMAAQMAPGAQVGKRTVALMIDAALVQAQARQPKASGGLKALMIVTVLLVVVGLVAGGAILYVDRQHTAEQLAQVTSIASPGEGGAGERITSDNEAAIYMLASVRADGRSSGFCTGFAVTADLIATNAHCVDAARERQARGEALAALRNNGRGEQTPVVPVFRDPRFRDPNAGSDGAGFDVGLLRSSVPLPRQVRLVPMAEIFQVRPGASIFVYGFPGNTMNEGSPVATITQGVVNRFTDFFDRAAEPAAAFKVQHSAQTTSGSSGSPIFLASGLVVGINAGSIADEERQRMIDPRTGQSVSVEVSRSSNFKYGMRADLIRAVIQAVGETAP